MDFASLPPYLKHIIVIVGTIIIFLLIIKIISHFLKKTGKRLEIDPTVIQVLNEILKYSFYVIAVTIILGELGINVTGIMVSLGIAGVAFGFAARDIIANFISGLFILADRSFKVGDIIEVSNQKGKVVKVGFRITTVITPDKKIITIPNSSFSKNLYLNYTSSEIRRVDLDMVIPYNMDLEDVNESIVDVVGKFEWALDVPKPEVIVKELSDVGVKAKITVWVDDPWKIVEYRSSLAKEIKNLLKYDD